jgi:hypothetical protein
MRHLLPLLAAVALAGKAAAAPPPAAGKETELDPQAKRITGSDNYVPTFGRGFKLHGVLAVDAGLDVPKEETRKTCAAIRPRLTSAMRDAILNYASLSYVVGEKPDVDILSTRLQKAVDGVLGKGLARVALASVIVFDK